MQLIILQSLCSKIAQSVVVVGLYFGFLTTFSIGPSFFFLIKTRVMEEGVEKNIASATGFVVGQLIMLVSVYYLPLHLALSQPHTTTILVVLYFVFHFLSYKDEDFLDYEYGLTTQNSMRNLSIQCVFLNNLIFQLLNHFILPSSTLARLVNIYMFRCNNKILFVTSSFFAWFIGQILLTKWLGLVLFWIRQTYAYAYGSKKYKGLVLHWKYTLLDWTYISSMDQIFRIPLFVICAFYLGRVPIPGFDQKKSLANQKESLVNLVNQKQSKTKAEKLERYNRFIKRLVTELFDSRGWNRPFQYIQKNPSYEGAVQDIPVQNEMGQYFFGTCRSDGKKRISFTYRPGFKEFLESLAKEFAFVYFVLFKKETRLRRFSKLLKSQKDLYNNWISSNERKKYNLINELRSRIKVLEEKEGFLALDMLEKRVRLCNDENEQECFSKRKDPLLNGPDRSTMDISEKRQCFYRKKEHPKEKMEKSEKTKDAKEKKKGKKEFDIMPIPITKMSPSDRLRLMERIARTPRSLIYTIVATDPTTQKVTKMPKFRKALEYVFAGEYEEMRKDVPKWLTNFISDLDVLEEVPGQLVEDVEDEDEENEMEEKEKKKRKKKDEREYAEIPVRRLHKVPIYTMYADDLLEDVNDLHLDPDLAYKDEEDQQSNENAEYVTLTRYLKRPDFREGIIRGSMRTLRRKKGIWDLYQSRGRSPIFLDRTENTLFSFFRRIVFSVFNIFLKLFQKVGVILRNSVGRKPEWKILQKEEAKEMDLGEQKKNRKMKRKQNKKKIREEEREKVKNAWLLYSSQRVRGLILLTQSYLRKYIVLPSLIIAKNLGRMVLFQSPEWYEDFKEWDKEIHVICTRDGVELSEKDSLLSWLEGGIQIKILFPFHLKPWRRSKKEQPGKSCFLTVFGKETKVPFWFPRRQPSFFRPIYKELEKKMREVKKKFFPLFEVFKEGIIQKVNKQKVYELTENEKDSKINKNIIDEPTIEIPSMNWTIESLIERKMQNLSDRTIRIRNEIEQITKEKNKILFICDDKRPESQKPIWKIFQRKSIRLIRKSHYFVKFFIEKTYVNILLWMINNLSRTRINSQLFFESIKKMIKKLNKRNQEGREERDKNTMNFFWTQKKNHSKMDYDLSSLSQAYVFYKLSQSPLLNKYRLRSLLQYHETYPFIKDQIKDYCRRIFDSKSRHKKMTKSQSWKNWLRGHYQYNLSQTKWSRLEPQEWRNRIHQHSMIPNKDSITLDSYKKEKDIDYVKQTSYGFDSFPSIKEKLQKNYRYDLLSNLYMNYGAKKDLSIYRFVSIAISDYLEGASYPWKNRDRKYVDCRILKNLNKRYMSQKEDSDKKKKKDFLDWKKMNKEWKRRNEERVVGSKSWFFPELVLLLNAYKKKPWITPIQLLLSDLDPSKDRKIKDTKNGKKKESEPVQEGKTYYVKKKYNKEEEDFIVQVHFGAYLKKRLGEKQKKNGVRPLYDIQELDLFLKKSFLHQFRFENSHAKKNIMSTLDASFDLLRLWKDYFKECFNEKQKRVPISRKTRTRDPIKMSFAAIERKEVDLQLMEMVTDRSDGFPPLFANQSLICEEFRLCQKIDGKSILYQMISINTSSFNKNQHQTQDFLRPEDILSSRRCRELRILSSFNYPNWNVTDRKSFYVNKYMNRFDFNKKNIKNSGNEYDITNSGQLLNVFNEEELNRDANEFVKCKSFLWPNYRLEDLLCMNRYWFDTNNGSRFSMLRIHMYPQSRIQK